MLSTPAAAACQVIRNTDTDPVDPSAAAAAAAAADVISSGITITRTNEGVQQGTLATTASAGHDADPRLVGTVFVSAVCVEHPLLTATATSATAARLVGLLMPSTHRQVGDDAEGAVLAVAAAVREATIRSVAQVSGAVVRRGSRVLDDANDLLASQSISGLLIRVRVIVMLMPTGAVVREEALGEAGRLAQERGRGRR